MLTIFLFRFAVAVYNDGAEALLSFLFTLAVAAASSSAEQQDKGEILVIVVAVFLVAAIVFVPYLSFSSSCVYCRQVKRNADIAYVEERPGRHRMLYVVVVSVVIPVPPVVPLLLSVKDLTWEIGP